MIRFNWKYLMAAVVTALALCAAQIYGSRVLILACCAAFVVQMLVAGLRNHTLPLLLFFLPWSPLLRTSPQSFSFYTIALVMLCAIKAGKNFSRFKRHYLTTGILLLLVTLLSKLINGSFLELSYICFILMIVVFPTFRLEEQKSQYGFYEAVVYFSAGIVIAALCAQEFATFGNIAKYIRVDSYSTIVRRCGFYGDPNYYTAQITAAIAGCLVLLLKERKKARSVILCFLLLLLLYCGFLSGSKSFVLILAIALVLWAIELLRMRGRLGLKIILSVTGVVAAMYIATSALFSELIDVLVVRFSAASDVDGFTTGRTELWASYADAIINDWKTLLLGQGYTNVKVNGRGSHSTLIQMIYQFGLLGAPVLIAWIVHYWRPRGNNGTVRTMRKMRNLVLLTGVLLPWLAIDMLFFDEFFLLQWYCYAGIQAMYKVTLTKPESEPQSEQPEDDPEPEAGLLPAKDSAE